MQKNIRFSSIRLLITLFVSMLSIMLLQNYRVLYSNYFIFNAVCIIISFFIIFLFYLPTSIIKKRTDLDFLSFAHLKTPYAIIFISAYYCIYFVYAITYFLYIYSDMFVNKINKEANIYVIAFLVLFAAVYASSKGVNVISRYSIFIFSFVIISLLIIFSGNIPNINFDNNSFVFISEKSSLIDNVSYFLIPSFSAVIFAGTSEYTKKFKVRQVAFSLAITLIVFILIIFFISFCLGSYVFQQSYQFFLLSKTAHLGVVSGIESFYLVLVTAVIFLTVSMMLTVIAKSTGKENNIRILLMFALIISILFICINKFENLSKVLLNYTVLNIMSFIAAGIIPSIYLLIYRRRMYV